MCFVPFVTRNKLTGESQVAPCGKCPACQKRRIHQWTFRLQQEDKKSISSHFITLTYDTKTIPITPRGNYSLDKRDYQKFVKRLRKASPCNGRPIKYYMVGEYGEDRDRPHYHAIIFNATAENIIRSWDNGIVHFGTVETKSIQYTVGYFSKGSQIPCNDYDDRIPKFALMSKGLGLNYLTKAMQAWHKKDLLNRMYLNGSDKKKVSMPRYYKNKIYHDLQRKAIAVAVRIQTDKDYAEAIKKDQFYETNLFQDRKAAIDLETSKKGKRQLSHSRL